MILISICIYLLIFVMFAVEAVLIASGLKSIAVYISKHMAQRRGFVHTLRPAALIGFLEAGGVK